MLPIDHGATVIVIEHDLDVIRSADNIIDMGPGGGEDGGRTVACGTPEKIRLLQRKYSRECLFYCAIAASASYYNLTFWRLAQGTKRPALWASMGRILDSAMVLLTWALRIFTLPGEAMLAVNLAGLAAIILLMAVGGDFNLTVPAAPEPAPAALSAEAALERMRERYALTKRETDVLRELVITEDKQTVIGERLSIAPRTVQSYVTALYQKTGASTRSGLTGIYRGVAAGG